MSANYGSELRQVQCDVRVDHRGASSVLFGVPGTDIVSYALAAGTLLLVSATACVVPMR